MINTADNRQKDIAARLRDIAYDFYEFTQKEFPDLRVDASEKVIDEKESETVANEIKDIETQITNIKKPRVMVYGIYNSGKSTLINALCKEEKAKVADIPTTSEIAEYERENYFLVDSPGVDAPIEHEKVTEENIRRCHVILFVISSKGGFEDRKNYVRLVELIQKKIPFIMVLNDRGVAISKNATETERCQIKIKHEQELKDIQYKMIGNLKKISKNEKITDEYDLVKLNAKAALTGILKKKPKLIENSGIDILEKRIDQLLYNGKTNKSLLLHPIYRLNECLNLVEKKIVQNISGNYSEGFDSKLRVLSFKREEAISNLKTEIDMEVMQFLEDLASRFSMGGDDLNIEFETIANDIMSSLYSIYPESTNELWSYIKKNFNISIDGKLQIDTNDLLPEIQYEFSISEYTPIDEAGIVGGKKSILAMIFNCLKSNKRKEEEKARELDRLAEVKNANEENFASEALRIRQEARMYAEMALGELLKELNKRVLQALNKKYNEAMDNIMRLADLTLQEEEKGKRQKKYVSELRAKLLEIENTVS